MRKSLLTSVSIFLIACCILFKAQVYANNLGTENAFYRALQINNNSFTLNFWGHVPIEQYQIDPDDPSVMPIIHEGRTMLPMRATASFVSWDDGAQYYDVEWNANEMQATLVVLDQSDPSYIRPVADFWIGRTTAVFFDNEGQNPRQVEIPIAPTIFNDRTYLPLRAVADAVDHVNIEWVASHQGIVIYFVGSRPQNVMFPDGSVYGL